MISFLQINRSKGPEIKIASPDSFHRGNEVESSRPIEPSVDSLVDSTLLQTSQPIRPTTEIEISHGFEKQRSQTSLEDNTFPSAHVAENDVGAVHVTESYKLYPKNKWKRSVTRLAITGLGVGAIVKPEWRHTCLHLIVTLAHL